MVNFFKKLPIPLAGLTLAILASGNIIATSFPNLKIYFGLIGGLFLISFTLKIFLNFKSIKDAMKNPILGSIIPTYSMAIIIFSPYLKKFNPNLAKSLWFLGIAIHLIFIIIFTKNFFINFNYKKLFPSYFIVYVGIMCASVTAPAFKMQFLGKIIFWFGFLSYLILFPMILRKVFKIKNIPKKAKPIIAIFSAPASLCLAGYLSSFNTLNSYLFYFLLFMSVITSIVVLLFLPRTMKNGFFPSYAAFTFPYVITSIAGLKSLKYLSSINKSNYILSLIINFQKWLALLIVGFVFIQYINFLSKNLINKKENLKRKKAN